MIIRRRIARSARFFHRLFWSSYSSRRKGKAEGQLIAHWHSTFIFSFSISLYTICFAQFPSAVIQLNDLNIITKKHQTLVEIMSKQIGEFT